MFLPAASLLGPPFSSHPPQTFLHPWGVSAEPVNHKFIFCTAQRAAAPRMPALHLAWLRQAVAGEPEIPPARTPTLPPPTRAWGLVGPPVVRVKAGADWSRCGECSSCSSISLPPCRVSPRPSWIRVPSKPCGWRRFGTHKTGPGSAPSCRLRQTVQQLRVQILER